MVAVDKGQKIRPSINVCVENSYRANMSKAFGGAGGINNTKHTAARHSSIALACLAAALTCA